MTTRALTEALSVATTTAHGVVQLATSGEAAAAKAVAGTDARLADSRTPTGHHTTHSTGGSDAIAPGDIGAQPADSDLTALAALAPANDDVIQRKAGAWTNRTLAQLIADLIAVGAWTEAVQDVIGAMVAAAGGSYDDAGNAITLPKGLPLALAGATAATRYVGGTATGAPTTGTFATGDFVIAQIGTIWICTAAGTPGTWAQVSGGGGGGLTVQEADGAPSVAATTLILPNGTLTDNGGGSVTYTPTVGATGAPVGAPYVTTASDSTLTAEVAIPGLAASPDRAGVGGATLAQEYDTTTHGLTQALGTLAAIDSNTTVPNHLYLRTTDASEHRVMRAFTPTAGAAFDVRAHFALGATATLATGGLFLSDTGGNAVALVNLTVNSTVAAFSGSGFTNIGTVSYGLQHVYMRITRDTSNLYGWYFSSNGLVWTRIGTATLAATVGNVGYRTSSQNGGTVDVLSDWLRIG